jgi:hypothetical protein
MDKRAASGMRLAAGGKRQAAGGWRLAVLIRKTRALQF